MDAKTPVLEAKRAIEVDIHTFFGLPMETKAKCVTIDCANATKGDMSRLCFLLLHWTIVPNLINCERHGNELTRGATMHTETSSK